MHDVCVCVWVGVRVCVCVCGVCVGVYVWVCVCGVCVCGVCECGCVWYLCVSVGVCECVCVYVRMCCTLQASNNLTTVISCVNFAVEHFVTLCHRALHLYTVLFQ
jgi:hypothetical protein